MDSRSSLNETRYNTPEAENHGLRPGADGGRSRGWWIGAGIVVLLLGIVQDLRPGLFDHRGTALSWILLVVLVISLTRSGRVRLGGPARPASPSGPKRWILAVVGGLGALAVVLAAARWTIDVPHFGLILGIVGALLLAVVGPVWENHLRNRRIAKS